MTFVSKYFLSSNWFYLLLILSCVLFQNKNNYNNRQYFTKKQIFSSNDNSNIYDDFYINIYDKLMVDKNRINYELNSLIRTN